jgi:sugar (pentulose or hexulose) kinase
MTGGVAKNPAAVHFLSRALGLPVQVPADPQISGAYGAALLAGDEYRRQAGADDVEVAETASGAVHSCDGCDGHHGPADQLLQIGSPSSS